MAIATSPNGVPAESSSLQRLIPDRAGEPFGHDGLTEDARNERARFRDALREAEHLILLALAELRAAMGTSEEASPLLHVIGGNRVPLAAPTSARSPVSSARAIENESRAVAPPNLTQRELAVLRLLARHQTDKEIALALSISPRTAGAHVGNILRKLGVKSRRGAISYAQEHGLD
jgi:DNA-binding CsgD family transcriptional regulator